MTGREIDELEKLPMYNDYWHDSVYRPHEHLWYQEAFLAGDEGDEHPTPRYYLGCYPSGVMDGVTDFPGMSRKEWVGYGHN